MASAKPESVEPGLIHPAAIPNTGNSGRDNRKEGR
jgi:hypothetical protein